MWMSYIITISTMVYAGNKRTARLEKSSPMEEVILGQYTCTTVSCNYYRGGMLARNGKKYMRNMRRYYDNLRPLIVFTSYLAVPSKIAKDFGMMWGLFQEF